MADIARRGKILAKGFGEVKITKGIEAVIDRNEDDIAFLRQVTAIVCRPSAGTIGVTTTVEPDHGQVLSGRCVWRPDIEEKAILIIGRRLGTGGEHALHRAGQISRIWPARSVKLHAWRAHARCIGNAVPSVGCLGRFEAQFSDGPGGVTDAEKASTPPFPSPCTCPLSA